ncbi:hypothetical protein NP493_37g03020 [Ridgeia piscesae]|uniref:Uncharacterized protein n=1 Tax=Ridgeia piscesae TaxID=27915 RepID=A0AAD9PC87_RIDPI|nr:hypothetical protein NP493_37g03020 [Ridgeia piscesae]
MESVSEATMRFHWADYVVFSMAVAGSTAIGLYHGFTRRKNAGGIDDYLMAGRRMPVLPVSLSHYVTWLSAISFLSDPVEVYYHGVIYWVIGVGYALGNARHCFDPNPLARSTVWTYLIGGFFRVFNPYISKQTHVQRYKTVNTAKEAQLSVYWNMPMYLGMTTLFAITGLVLFATYHKCDPFLAGRITKRDQSALGGLFTAFGVTLWLGVGSMLQTTRAPSVLATTADGCPVNATTIWDLTTSTPVERGNTTTRLSG